MELQLTVAGKLLAFVTVSFEHGCVAARVPRLMFQTYFGPTVPEIDGVLDKVTESRFRLVLIHLPLPPLISSHRDASSHMGWLHPTPSHVQRHAILQIFATASELVPHCESKS